MRKTFMGVRLKTLREQRGLTQAALAKLLNLSPSYLNQLENNERPLSVPVLLRLQSSLGADLQFFSEDEEARLMAQLQEVVIEGAGPNAVPAAELQAMAQQLPALSEVLVRLHRRCRDAEERVSALVAGLGDDRQPALSPLQPHEEVRDFFYARHNYIAALDEHAEALLESLLPRKARGRKPDGGAAAFGSAAIELAARLTARLQEAHGVRVEPADGAQAADEFLRRFDPAARALVLPPGIEASQRAFQIATQLAYLEAGDTIDALAREGTFSGPQAVALARIGLASYFAGAVVLPYRRFLDAAEALRYDIDLLAERFGVSFETVCHRLSTLQRPDARGVPFFFVRVDRAGNISKRQSATDFHFSRTGGTCPLWNVYEAFAQPDKVLTQLASMPDGRTYLWIARCVTHRRGGYGTPARSFAIGLGCDPRHASRLVYSKGLDFNDPDATTPIGAGCRICERSGCAQRAFPALGRDMQIDENLRQREPYALSREH